MSKKVGRRAGLFLVALSLLVGVPARASANGLPAVWSNVPGGAVQILQLDAQTPISVLQRRCG